MFFRKLMVAMSGVAGNLDSILEAQEAFGTDEAARVSGNGSGCYPGQDTQSFIRRWLKGQIQ